MCLAAPDHFHLVISLHFQGLGTSSFYPLGCGPGVGERVASVDLWRALLHRCTCACCEPNYPWVVPRFVLASSFLVNLQFFLMLKWTLAEAFCFALCSPQVAL